MGKDFYGRDDEQVDYNSHGYGAYDEGSVAVQDSAASFVSKVYGWMFMGLLITAIVSFAFTYGIYNIQTVNNLANGRGFFTGIIIAELVAVFAITLGIKKISAPVASMLFILYAALNGITITYVCLAYAQSTVFLAFAMTAVFFGTMSVYGLVTKTDLSRFGSILMGGLFALVIAMVINMFLRSSSMDYIVCIAGIGLFTGLTAYDIQRIKTSYYNTAVASGGDMASKIAIYGALQLYLDFINMFLYILRLLGRKK